MHRPALARGDDVGFCVGFVLAKQSDILAALDSQQTPAYNARSIAELS
jgi:hypothetical protein